jgi:CBS domain-containing protein
MLLTVADLMHAGHEVPMIGPKTPMPDALLVMTEQRFGCVAVCDEHGRLEGVITDGGADVLTRVADRVVGAGANRKSRAQPRAPFSRAVCG